MAMVSQGRFEFRVISYLLLSKYSATSAVVLIFLVGLVYIEADDLSDSMTFDARG